MFKKILKGIGITVLVIVLLFIGIGSYTGYKTSEYEETAVPYLKEAVPALSKWDIELSKEYFSSIVFEDTTDEDLAKLFNWLSKLGVLESLEEFEFINLRSGVNTKLGSHKLVTYQTKAHFENGAALITVRLLDKDQVFKVYSFHVNSDALIE